MAERLHWRRLSPAGGGAISVLRLDGPRGDWPDWLRSASGKRRPWPPSGRLEVGRLETSTGTLDEVVCLAISDTVLELHVHGGSGILGVLSESLAAAGWAREDGPLAWAPTSIRAATALASTRWGLLAQAAAATRVGGVTAERPAASAPSEHGLRLRRPAVVRLVGHPNAGKSTLFNRLVGDGRSTISATPGTTRDSVAALVLLRGVPIRLEDTAGCAGAGDRHAAGAELLVYLRVPSEPAPPPRGGMLVVGGRADTSNWGLALSVSGRTGQGLAQLCSAMADALGIASDLNADLWTYIEG